ncbi:glutamate ABC transporter substrate-binding protein [Salinibacterium sp. NSLL150]|uniref:glutamate ABC transporter substrate-binding protein n=1 Tax=unclassified Salinibacterium TaxID=2632331 RepID=UPI0018CCFCD7|nr:MULTISPECIES: glutamate ABC transporter substrate-binding protein [unclassified Salinibacterium]MBH0100050.1 glutamate ABC transporter substrate-binding protein [Salinibacterium sp. NSLL35]MBH0102804.1 glutamate ABC transporter substrate-binding protein [Salinibacterium sp. NSLL150]MBH0105564.1 glutamate ABC transporter substrate-binding protein [Salinibacterium sp. NSLL16]MBH0108324.1 glutamate ABC transporter substrate-binding protein [Salinibacterium sp. NSLL17]
MRLKKGLMISAIAAVGLLGLSACAADTSSTTDSDMVVPDFEAGTTMADLAEAGSITIGTKFDQPLFGLVGPTGEPVGFDVEIGKIIASSLGISEDNIEWVETVSANRETFIENGTVDIVIATYTINDDRKEVISFAGPYYNAGQDILVLDGNPEGITGPEDLAGMDVCSVAGSTSEANIAEYDVNLITTDTYSNCLEPLRNGNVVAVTTDNVILAGLADQNPGEFEVLSNPFTEEPYGIGLGHDDDEFRDYINDVLETSYSDGSWDEAWNTTAGQVLKLPTPPAVDRYSN